MDATVVAAAKQGFGYTLASIGVFVALLLFLLAMFKAEWIGLSRPRLFSSRLIEWATSRPRSLRGLERVSRMALGASSSCS